LRFALLEQGAGIGGSNATCVELGPKQGGLTLASRQAQKEGYQPFGKATALEFWLKDKNGSSTIPDLSVNTYCLQQSSGILSCPASCLA